jgi:hypothetical protein
MSSSTSSLLDPKDLILAGRESSQRRRESMGGIK